MVEKDKKSVFKEVYKRFNEAVNYIVRKESELKHDPKRWERIKNNFYEKFEKPLDEAWEALDAEDKKKFASLYLFRKAAQDETVQKVIKTFGGHIVKVTLED